MKAPEGCIGTRGVVGQRAFSGRLASLAITGLPNPNKSYENARSLQGPRTYLFAGGVVNGIPANAS
jgi:hypothetical protein